MSRQVQRADARAQQKAAERIERAAQKAPPIPLRSGVIDPLRRMRGYVNALNPQRRVIEQISANGAPKYAVPSETHPGVSYDVFQDVDERWICTPCPDFRENGEPCKHIYEVLDRFHEGQVPPPAPADLVKFVNRGTKEWYADARRFPKKWHDYEDGPAESTREDVALEEMDDQVEVLLADLAFVLNAKHPYRGMGTPGMRPGEKVLLMVLRAHHGKSMRIFHSMATRLCADARIPFVPGRTAWVDWNTSPETSTLLLSAFEEVTAPYRICEDGLLADATGFSPFFVSNWRDSEYGSHNLRSGTEWFKEHVLVGRRSKAILGFRITPSHGEGIGDDTNLPLMLDDLYARGFDYARTIIADNIYLTKDNFDDVARRGVMLVGPLKPRNFGRDGLPRAIVARLVSWIRQNPEEYDELKRARQAVEGVFWCQKRDDNHVAAIGTAEEREKQRELIAAASKAATPEERKQLLDEAGVTGLYVSRINEFLLRVICQVLRRTVVMKLKYNRPKFSYRLGSVFAPVREYSPEEDDDAA